MNPFPFFILVIPFESDFTYTSAAISAAFSYGIIVLGKILFETLKVVPADHRHSAGALTFVLADLTGFIVARVHGNLYVDRDAS